MKKPPVTRDDRIVFIVQNIDKLILKSFQGGVYSRSISDYSLEKLNAMADDELEMVLTRFDEFHEYYREEAENKLFFNRSSSFADNDFWCKKPLWSIEEGIFLVLERDPRKVTRDLISSYSNSQLYKKFEELYELAYGFVEIRKLAVRNSPDVFIAWARCMEQTISEDLLACLEKNGREITDWKMKYEQSNEIIVELNQSLDILNKQLAALRLENAELETNARIVIVEGDEYYSQELDAALIIQQMLYARKTPIQDWKEEAAAILELSYPTLYCNASATERITVIVNPIQRKKGGAKKKGSVS